MESVAAAVDGMGRVLDKEGRVIDGAQVPDLDDDTLLEMYREMRLTRHFDERAVNLQRQGRIGTFPPAAGQEGAQIGSIHAIRDTDWVVSQYREHGVPIARGIDLSYLLRYWMGDEAGNAALADLNIFPLNISIGSQLPHATGIGWAAELLGDDRIVCCHFGDGATSEGDFHEALNFAGVFDIPVIFFCNNNQWAISVPRNKQTASETIAGKATAYGFDGVQVDGMDPLAVYQVTRMAAEKAMAHSSDSDELRPTLIEAVQYRFGAHTTADDPSVYRSKDEVEEWKKRDPISRFEAFLRRTGRLDSEHRAAIGSQVQATVTEAIEVAEASMEREPDDMFESVFETATDSLVEQQSYFRRLRDRYGDDALLGDE